MFSSGGLMGSCLCKVLSTSPDGKSGLWKGEIFKSSCELGSVWTNVVKKVNLHGRRRAVKMPNLRTWGGTSSLSSFNIIISQSSHSLCNSTLMQIFLHYPITCDFAWKTPLDATHLPSSSLILQICQNKPKKLFCLLCQFAEYPVIIFLPKNNCCTFYWIDKT